MTKAESMAAYAEYLAEQYRKREKEIYGNESAGCINSQSLINSEEKANKRTAELINQLYHENAQLRKVIKNHCEMLKYYGEGEKIDFLDRNHSTTYSAEFNARLQAFITDHG